MFPLGLLLLGLAGLALAALAVLSTAAVQRRLIFFPEVLADDTAFDFGAPHTEVWFDSPTGHRLHGVRVVPARGPEPGRAIVYLHGNAGSIRSWGFVGSELAAFGYVVYVVDYAGFGKSTGALTEASLLTDVEAVYDTVAANHADVTVFGRSVGSGPAVHLAATRRPRLLVLETPYASFTDLAKRLVPLAPSWLLAFTLRSDLWLKDVRCPVHVFHGTDDEVIPLASAQALVSSAPLPPGSSVTVVDGGHHNDLSTFPVYARALAGVLGP